jgi:hypothetical protein
MLQVAFAGAFPASLEQPSDDAMRNHRRRRDRHPASARAYRCAGDHGPDRRDEACGNRAEARGKLIAEKIRRVACEEVPLNLISA